ncbi:MULTISPECIES: class I SAM-dependent methyltransferase [unclassified Endozoicomonas]|uniref:class I SAM-dependent methyltransferase n=1 Tax=unclassified Endozoicomonas TaxID=2644528 RepID=UPI0021492601|nr:MULTISPECIES: class I SAM-dependent methyltransferase [unclassified Endozoicomonas]
MYFELKSSFKDAVKTDIEALRKGALRIKNGFKPMNEALSRMEDNALCHDMAKGREVIDEILTAPPEQLRRRAYLLQLLKRFGCIYQGWELYGAFQEYISASNFGLLQIPTEYVDFLLLCIEREPASFIEIGVMYGGFATFTSAVLSRFNAELEYHCVDIEDNFRDWDHYAQRLPLRKQVSMTSADFCGRAFDVVFIDGDHSYHGMKRDFMNLGRYARLCGFHDIHGTEYDHLDGGTRRCWNDLRLSYRERQRVTEITHMNEQWMGIGVIEFQ